MTTRPRLELLFTALSILLLSAAPALAQEAEAAADAAPEAAPAEPAATEGAPAEDAATEEAAAEEAAAEEAEQGEGEAAADSSEHFPRFRFGISFMGGPMAGGLSGGVGGIDSRLGVQLSELLAINAQPVLMFGAGTNSSVAGASASALAVIGVGVLADFSFLDFLYAGIGPAILGGGMAESGTGAGATSASGGAFFALATRAGVALGSYKPERRSGFTIGLDMHVIFANEVVLTPLIALGYESF